MRGLRSQNSAEYVVCRMQSIVNESPSMLGAGFVWSDAIHAQQSILVLVLAAEQVSEVE